MPSKALIRRDPKRTSRSFHWTRDAHPFSKDSLLPVRVEATIAAERSPKPEIVLPNITVVRRRNALALYQDHAGRALAAGQPAKGLEQAFAAVLQVSPSLWSQIKSARPIGDKLARQIEQACGKPSGWLDQERPSASLSDSEQRFLDLALRAWRATNAAGRKELRTRLAAVAEAGSGG